MREGNFSTTAVIVTHSQPYTIGAVLVNASTLTVCLVRDGQIRSIRVQASQRFSAGWLSRRPARTLEYQCTDTMAQESRVLTAARRRQRLGIRSTLGLSADNQLLPSLATSSIWQSDNRSKICLLFSSSLILHSSLTWGVLFFPLVAKSEGGCWRDQCQDVPHSSAARPGFSVRHSHSSCRLSLHA